MIKLLSICTSLSTLFVCLAFEQCKNNRACPDTHTCSEDNVFCCKNNTCDIRSSWSLLTSTCKDPNVGCPKGYVCNKDQLFCTSKTVFICDAYLDLETIAKCGDDGFLIKNAFSFCNLVHSTFDNDDYKWGAFACINNCVRNNLEPRITWHTNETCDQIRKIGFENITDCYVDCGACFESDLLEYAITLFNASGMPQWTINEKAKKCSQKFADTQDHNHSLEAKVHHFVSTIHEKTGLDVREHFDWLTTTTETPTTTTEQLTTSTHESTTTEPSTTSHEPSIVVHTNPSIVIIEDSTDSDTDSLKQKTHRNYKNWVIFGFSSLIILTFVFLGCRNSKRRYSNNSGFNPVFRMTTLVANTSV